MARAGIQPIPAALLSSRIVARRWRIYKYEITSQRKLTGQQTALFVSYDGDIATAATFVIVANPPVTVAHRSCPPTRAPASQRMAPTKILALHHVRNTGAY